ncbi:M28 family metallopeptidase [Patiriisocius hiemis]|uniref:M20/M25/M40 family metallo-hydrolase n=1 Tax=Patiriisocius hiemis TaxID=3075604 RepID=A0ABU2YD96_9FLAO|nr:M20/M25/M40 family metallo-hydrolase [Constantimarinum sp. W242]MDT0556148.1 M20/M25/M40 family metallo-hydrolase [Constantimarinum sp. W242]
MKNILKILLLSLMVISCQDKVNNGVLLTENLPNNKADYQKTIIGQLSGKYTLGNNTTIKSRWSKDERELTKRYLKELISTLGIEAKEHKYTSPNLNPGIDLIFNPFKGSNIYGILPSTNNSSDYVILGGHYDSGKRNAPGAIDNATGIALIYSVAKELSRLQRRNKNIVIVFFDQEEEELIGSKAFARLLKKKSWNIHSIHCFDMVGWDGDNDKAMEIFSGTESLINLYKSIADQKGIPIKDIKINPVGYDNSSTDFDVFVPFGFNVIGAGECFYHRDSTPYKDSPDDTYETVNFEYLLSCTNLIENIVEKIVTE